MVIAEQMHEDPESVREFPDGESVTGDRLSKIGKSRIKTDLRRLVIQSGIVARERIPEYFDVFQQ